MKRKRVGNTFEQVGLTERAMATKVTRKGQVTIPKPVRDRLKLRPGTAVEFSMAEDGRIVLSRADGRMPPSRFDLARGMAKRKMTTDEIMALLRDDD